MDGVLVDSEPLYRQSNFRIFAELGIRVSDDEYHDFVGSSADRMWSTLKERFRLAEPVGSLVRREADGHYGQLLAMDSLSPIPGVEELLRALEALPARLAVASSSARRVVDLTLAKTGLGSFFGVTVAGEEVARGKPHPDIFLETARRLKVAPGQCLVLEDSPRGIAGARAAGMVAVGFRNPNSGRQDLSEADLVVDSFSKAGRRRILDLAMKGGRS